MTANMGEQISAMFDAKNQIVEECGGPVRGTDLITILADALVNDGIPDEGMTLQDVKDLVFSVQLQRQAAAAEAGS